MRMLIAGKSGWGKSYVAQSYLEDNLDEFDHVVILDWKDEFRGLAKEGFVRWMGVDDAEAGLEPSEWATIIEQNPKLIVARAVDNDSWIEVVATIAQAARMVEGNVLIGVDEAHTVAPQSGALLKPIELLATTGRGGVSSVWMVQRLQKLDETVISQTNARLLGGFGSKNDRGKLDVEYPVEVHNPQASGPIRNLPEELHHPTDGAIPLQKQEENGVVVMSEWVYSDDDGYMERRDSSKIEMQSTHYGGSDKELRHPF